jgi:hypothetical protein
MPGLPESPPGDRNAAASYIADLSSSLAVMARENGFNALGYLLELAHMEAQDIVRMGRAGGPAGPPHAPSQ